MMWQQPGSCGSARLPSVSGSIAQLLHTELAAGKGRSTQLTAAMAISISSEMRDTVAADARSCQHRPPIASSVAEGFHCQQRGRAVRRVPLNASAHLNILSPALTQLDPSEHSEPHACTIRRAAHRCVPEGSKRVSRVKACLAEAGSHVLLPWPHRTLAAARRHGAATRPHAEAATRSRLLH
jgi:hypothetical protein